MPHNIPMPMWQALFSAGLISPLFCDTVVIFLGSGAIGKSVDERTTAITRYDATSPNETVTRYYDIH